MNRDIFLLGSTGSIGETSLNIINKDKKKFKIKLLTTNNNIEKILSQAIAFDVNKIVIFNQKKIKKKNLQKFKKKKN